MTETMSPAGDGRTRSKGVRNPPAEAHAVPGRAATKRRGGRFTQSRREEVVRKAALLFIRRGYEVVTIDDIVAEIGGSKATVYARFGGKADLFAAVIQEYCSLISDKLAVKLELSGTPGDQFRSIARTFLDLILRPETLELHRLIVSIGDRFPEVSKTFFDAGPGAAYKLAATWIERQQEAGLFRRGDPYLLATLFLDMLTANHQLRLLLAGRAAEEAEIDRMVEAACGLFLSGICTPVGSAALSV